MRIPKYRRNGDGRAFVYHHTIPTRSHRLYLGEHGTTESVNAYRRWVALFTASHGRHAEQSADRSLTLPEVAVEYLDHAERYYARNGSPSKEFREIRRAIRFLLDLFDATPLAEFGPRSLTQFQQYLVTRGYARGVINHHVGRIKRMFRWLCREEIAPPDLHHRLSTVSGLRRGRTTAREPDPILPVEWETVSRTLVWLSPTVATMVQMQYLCGMRPGEVVLMRWADIDTSRDLWLYSPQSHKTDYLGHRLIKPIPAPAQHLLSEYRHRPSTSYLFDPRDAYRWRIAQTSRSGHCQSVPARLRDHYDTGSYAHAITYGIQKAKRHGVIIPHWHPHQLRHAIATTVRQIAGEEGAQLWLGHAHLATTGIYTAKQINELERVATTVLASLPPAVTATHLPQTPD